jgi:hypothetical protein
MFEMVCNEGGSSCEFRCKFSCHGAGHTTKCPLKQYISLFQVENLVSEYRDGPDETDTQGLHTKTVGLQFQIQNEHFTNNGGGAAPRMEIRCSSTVGESTRHKVLFPALARPLTSNKLAQEGFRNSAGNILLHERAAEISTDENLAFYSIGREG